MKFKDYIPLYAGDLFGDKYCIAAFSHFTPDSELDDLIKDGLEFKDWLQLCSKLCDDLTEMEYIVFFRECFDLYKSRGGKPLFWINETLQKIELHPPAFDAYVIGRVQIALLEWEETYKKLESRHSAIVATGTTDVKLTLNQIALFHIYNNIAITRENGKAIAEKYGQSSGEKLYQKYTHYFSKQNRVGEEPTMLTTHNKIKLIDSIILILTDKGSKQNAIEEVAILKKIVSKYNPM